MQLDGYCYGAFRQEPVEEDTINSLLNMDIYKLVGEVLGLEFRDVDTHLHI